MATSVPDVWEQAVAKAERSTGQCNIWELLEEVRGGIGATP